MAKICVIGAGISGLTASYTLGNQGHTVDLIESSDRVGGVIRTHKEAGYLCELGPNTFFLKDEEVREFLEEIGAMDEVLRPNENAKRRYVVQHAGIQELPGSLMGFIRSGIFSWRAKLGLFLEPFAKRGIGDESIASFARRRLGKEILNYAINPFVSGVYAGDTERISVKYAFPKLYEMEQKYGSLLVGMMRSKRGMKREVITFNEGMETLPKLIAKRLKGRLRLNSRVDKIVKRGEKWEVAVNGESEEYDELVVAVPGDKLTKLPFPEALVEDLEFTQAIDYQSVAIITLGFRDEQIGKPLEGFGFLVPSVEKRKIMGAIVPSAIVKGRAPKGNTLICAFAGGAGNQGVTELSESDLVTLAQAELGDLMGIEGDAEYSHVKVWKSGIRQYNVGFGKFLEKIEGVEGKYEGIRFIGSYRNGVGLADCIKTGLKFECRKAS